MYNHTRIPVLIMHGETQNFRKDARELADFLVKESGYCENNIELMRGRDITSSNLQSFFSTVMHRPFVVAYTGHGHNNSLKTTIQSSLSYRKLSSLFPRQRFVFLNNSCNSGNAICYFEKQGLLEQGLVISASGAGIAYGDTFLREVMVRARKHQPFKWKAIAKKPSVGKLVLAPDSCKEGLISSINCVVFHPYKKPIAERGLFVQYPQRAGAPLDSLLYTA